jgi:hypothetical protein
MYQCEICESEEKLEKTKIKNYHMLCKKCNKKQIRELETRIKNLVGMNVDLSNYPNQKVIEFVEKFVLNYTKRKTLKKLGGSDIQKKTRIKHISQLRNYVHIKSIWEGMKNHEPMDLDWDVEVPLISGDATLDGGIRFIITNMHFHYRVTFSKNVDAKLQNPDYISNYYPLENINEFYVGTKKEYHGSKIGRVLGAGVFALIPDKFGVLSINDEVIGACFYNKHQFKFLDSFMNDLISYKSEIFAN